MEVEIRFFANFREAVGRKTIHREVADDATIGDLLAELSEEYPEMELLDEDGTTQQYITVMKDGKDIAHQDGIDTPLDAGTTVSAFPPVAGG